MKCEPEPDAVAERFAIARRPASQIPSRLDESESPGRQRQHDEPTKGIERNEPSRFGIARRLIAVGSSRGS